MHASPLTVACAHDCSLYHLTLNSLPPDLHTIHVLYPPLLAPIIKKASTVYFFTIELTRVFTVFICLSSLTELCTRKRRMNALPHQTQRITNLHPFLHQCILSHSLNITSTFYRLNSFYTPLHTFLVAYCT